MRRRGGGIGPACAWPDTPALLAHSGGRFHWAGDESRLTYAWAKWDDGDRAFHGHDYRRRNIALRPIAEYLGGEKHSLEEKSTWRTHHGKVRAEGPSGPPHPTCTRIGTRNVGTPARYTSCRMTKTALVRAPALWVEKEGETGIVVA